MRVVCVCFAIVWGWGRGQAILQRIVSVRSKFSQEQFDDDSAEHDYYLEMLKGPSYVTRCAVLPPRADHSAEPGACCRGYVAAVRTPGGSQTASSVPTTRLTDAL